MFSPYRTILGHPGSLAFSLTGWFARLPLSMVGLGLVLLVSATTGSYGLAGTISASYVIAAAVLAPVQARLVDRHGQHLVLPLIAALNAVALGGLIVAVRAGVASPLPQALAAVAGASGPLVGSYVRARWTHLLEGKPELHTAFALEALLDEVVFMVGPPLVTLLATTVSPVAGLVTAIVAGVVGACLLAAQRRTQPPVHRPGSGQQVKPPLGWPVLGPVVVACAGLGALFGSAEVVVVAVASDAGHRSASGLLLAGWATGSMLSALALGAMRLRMPPMKRFRLGAASIAATMLPLPFIGHLGVLGVVLFLAGFAISPTLVASMAVVQRTVPPARLNEGMAWTTTGMAAGVAAGAAVAGQVVDAAGGRAGFYVPLTAGVVTVLVAFVARAPRRGAPADVTEPVELTTT
ncbi:MFS transporter [Actinopolymorpha singaporensis]|uniref:Predicted arabinose efflux permease, MFS family n=1 Tax=Actinopolymorpha singaporensis TaxID=117157 RepID=A0A1H1V8G9_9ACTN|nr:MFS transporter [Actinopolymorpha singaporensis]SDS81025.1 Predicted arabinose efflux permease, MFS family [Actinopolymorpha singaporensis]